jgi:long-chain acyl-CoA synthetase
MFAFAELTHGHWPPCADKPSERKAHRNEEASNERTPNWRESSRAHPMRGVIAELARDAAIRFGEDVAIAFPGDRSFTFAEVEDMAGRFAGGLAALGIGKGDRVLLYLPNSWRWIVAYHAIARLGAVVVPTNILLSGMELAFIAADSAVAAAILAPEMGGADVGCALKIVPGGGTGRIAFEQLLQAEWIPCTFVEPNDLFTIGYTSGTTGRPKGAMLTHGAIFTSVAMTATTHVRTRADRVWSALPFPHVYGNVVMNAGFLTGARLTAPARFDAGQALADIGAERITLFEGVPTMYYQMLMHPDLAVADLTSLTRCTVGGQTMPVAKLEAVAERFGCPILELWGMTEVGGPATSHSPWWPARLGSIGLPFPSMEVRVAAQEPNGAGELMVRGPLVMRGYWNDPVATAETLDSEGWLATGDVARIDEDGYLFIVDRKKDMILTAGYNVYPAELEQAIASHSSVAMVAVVGRPDEEKGEVAQAFIVLQQGAEPDEAAIIAHCRERLAAYKIPRAVHFVEDLPRTSTGKIMRRALRVDAEPINIQREDTLA